MAINLDHVTEQITVTDTAANADLTLISKGTGAVNLRTNTGTQLKVVDATGTTVDNPWLVRGGQTFVSKSVLTSYAPKIQASDASAITFNTNAGSSGIEGGQQQFAISHTASAVNYVQVTGASTNNACVISAQGSDTNISLNIANKGTGATIVTGNNGTHFRVRTDIANATSFWEVFGSTSFPILRSTHTSGAIQISSGTLFVQTDTAGATQLTVSHTASAVNYVQVTGSSTGNDPTLSVQGSDTNINFAFVSKGSSIYTFASQGGSNRQFRIDGTSASVNYFNVSGSGTGFGPVLSALGTDTNIPLVLQPKGTGALQAQQTTSTDVGGNARGANAVDFQTARTSASQVASAQFSVVSGGYRNTANGYNSTVSGGDLNSSSSTYTFIGGGGGNSANQSHSVIVGGNVNTAAGYFNIIGGGSTNSGTSASAVTTQSATMNGTTAVTLSGSNGSIKVGQYITGTSIAFNTYVAAISGTSLTLSQVASGSSTSTLSFYTPHGVVVGGGNNQATGSYSFIGGGGDAGTAGNRNVASGDWSVVVGGNVVRATGKWSTAGGGVGNLASGEASVVVGGGSYGGGGSGNTASSTSSFVGAGYGNTANGYCSTVVGGTGNVASNNFSFVGGGAGNSANTAGTAILGGYSGTTRSIEGMQVMPACIQPITTTQGASQAALLILGRQTTDATATVLTSNTGAASTNNHIILPNNSAYFFTGEVVAGVTGGGDTKGWKIEGVIKRGANAASTALVGTPTVTSTYADAGASTWVIAETADTTNGGLAVTFTGQASTTIRTVAQIRTTEMTY
jgi:hypothetical protein